MKSYKVAFMGCHILNTGFWFVRFSMQGGIKSYMEKVDSQDPQNLRQV